MAGPLAHVRVLDLSRIMAGPWASQVLADLGADVIKVERPGAGDDTRSWGPPFLADRDGHPTGESGYFLSVNRGKRSITLDLATAEGQEIARRLSRGVDIVLENYKVGTLARYGLAYADLAAINPRLIYASISGFGQTGPLRDRAAYDFMIQAMGGLMSVTGEADGKPGGGPQKVGVPIVDLMTGMYAATAVLAALARRAETGRGDYIDIAMLDVQTAFLANQSMNYLVSGKPPRRTGNAHPNIQPQDVFACRDGYVALACGNDGQFAKLCAVLGRPELATDERYATNRARVRHLDTLTPILVDAFAAGDMADWAARLDAAGVPCGPINTIPGVLQEPQVVHRQMRRDVPHPLSGTVPQVVSPMRFAEAALEFEHAPPLLGQHTNEVLKEIGMDEARIKGLAERGVI